MAHPDVRGNPCSSASTAARDAAERALRLMMVFDAPPLAELDAAMAADPAWALPHVMKAGFLLSLTEPALRAEADSHLSHARALARDATPRERTHLEAVQRVLEGRCREALRLWDAVIVDHPRDALALQWAQLWDFYRGDAQALRQRPARALPEWDEADPLYPAVLALWAFGLEECNLYPQAEEAGRRALAIDPGVPWAVHAVTHVMEMQGRFEDGAAWLRQQQAHWAEGNGLACHLWWHKALFRLEAMDLAGALRMVDKHLSGEALQITLNRIDAASLLWRLQLLGEDVSAHGHALAEGWVQADDEAGHHAFNDVHRVLALLLAGEVTRAEAWLARCAERALLAADSGRDNHSTARDVGLPLMRGLIAMAHGDADAAADLISPVRGQAARFGGSQAQRDLIDLTLLAAAAAGGRRSLGRALLNERTMAKPASPLSRHWAARLAVTREVRA
jgi:tetratricopeptide (TPR) repeat protein